MTIFITNSGHKITQSGHSDSGNKWLDFVNSMGRKWAPSYLEVYNSFPEADRTVVFYDELVKEAKDFFQFLPSTALRINEQQILGFNVG